LTRKEEIKAMIRETVRKHMPTSEYKLFIFGSQANLQELKRSDIDVGIDAGRRLTSTELTLISFGLDELETLYFFDFVDFQLVRDRFKEIALENIELL
jgi:predicted nucleotidyltransferase